MLQNAWNHRIRREKCDEVKAKTKDICEIKKKTVKRFKLYVKVVSIVNGANKIFINPAIQRNRVKSEWENLDAFALLSSELARFI